jgi:hypothetical protein
VTGDDITHDIDVINKRNSDSGISPFAYIAPPGELTSLQCDVLEDPDTLPDVLVVGLLDYSDYSATTHHTSFCYVGRFNDDIIGKIRDRRDKHLPFLVPPLKEYAFEPCPSYNAVFD